MAAGSMKKKVMTAPGMMPAVERKASIKVSERGPSEKGTRRLVGVALGSDTVDVTGAVTGAIAHALWQLRGGADIANWVEAERLVDELLSGATEKGKGESLEVVVSPKRTPAKR